MKFGALEAEEWNAGFFSIAFYFLKKVTRSKKSPWNENSWSEQAKAAQSLGEHWARLRALPGDPHSSSPALLGHSPTHTSRSSNPIPRLTHNQGKAKLEPTAERSTKDKRKPSSVGSAAERGSHQLPPHPGWSCRCSSRKLRRPRYRVTKTGGALFCYVGWCKWIKGGPIPQTHPFCVTWDFVYLQSLLKLFLQTPASQPFMPEAAYML